MGTHLSGDISKGTQIHLQGMSNEAFLEKWSGRTNASVVTTFDRFLDDGRMLIMISGYDRLEKAAVEPNFTVHVAR